MARVVERAFKKQNITISTGTPVENVEAGKNSVKFTYGETERRGRLPLHRRRPGARHRGAQARRGRGRDRGRTARSRSTNTSAPRTPRSTRSATWSARKALAHKASEEGVVAVEHAAGVETHPVDQTWSPARPSATPRSPASASPRPRPRRPGTRSRSASSSSAGSAPGPSTTTGRAGQDRRRRRVRRDPRRPHRRQPRLRHDQPSWSTTMALEGGYQELARIVHPHPTISEAVLDAARAVDGWAIHQ